VIDDPLPPFDLPAWGEEAPGADGATEPGSVPAVRLSTRPAGDVAEIGLVSAEGVAPVGDDPGTALAAARMAALDRLVEEAARLGASAVVAVGLSPLLTKRTAAVLAYGTAVRPR